MEIKNINRLKLQELSSLIKEWEWLMDLGMALSDYTITIRNRVTKEFQKLDMAFISHNFALLGSKRYQKYKIKGRDSFVSIIEYERDHQKIFEMETEMANV
jgi:hypothetical protein